MAGSYFDLEVPNSATEQNPLARPLQIACFLFCLPSGAALLAKVYGLASMRVVTLWIALPCCIGLFAIWIWSRRERTQELETALTIGFVGGLLGTIGYDLSRIPFSLLGQRVFAPISAYGIWILEGGASSRFTDLSGWTYHFANGILFGIMYALFMRRRHWAWAVLWALMLETIAVVSPFARIFYLRGNYQALGIAYLGHVAYGLPPGLLVQKWNQSRVRLTAVPASSKWMMLILTVAIAGWLVLNPASISKDARVAKGEFRVEGRQLNPDWLRIESNGQIQVYNPGPDPVSVRVKQNNVTTRIASGQKAAILLPLPGIYQIFVESDKQTQSSFVMVEPVEKFK
jgi:hypothetical protein